MSALSAVVGLGIEGLLELVVPKLIELGAEELEKTDIEPLIRTLVPGERLDDFVVRLVKEKLPQLIASVKEHTGEDSVKKIIAVIKD